MTPLSHSAQSEFITSCGLSIPADGADDGEKRRVPVKSAAGLEPLTELVVTDEIEVPLSLMALVRYFEMKVRQHWLMPVAHNFPSV